MANPDQVALLSSDVMAWRTWRKQNPHIIPELREAKLGGLDLSEALLSHAVLLNADLSRANLSGAWLVEANLRGADLSGANLTGASLARAILSESTDMTLDRTTGSVVSSVRRPARLADANLSGAYLGGADLKCTDLSGANLSGADLSGATLVGTTLAGADLTGCRIYGMSAWDVNIEGATQNNLIVTPPNEPEITVDNLEVAQFIYLLLRNTKIRDVIDSITSKVVLILGRFTAERKAVLDSMRAELRRRNYLPVLFDFEKPASKDLTGTVSTLANMARFIIADLTDPSSIPHELAMVVPGTVVPVQPIIVDGQVEFSMFIDLKRRYGWVLEPYRYASQESLIANLGERVIRPAETKAHELRSVVP